MMTVKEVSKLTGISIRTLQYYDRIGLLRPARRTDSGYRLYDDSSLETLKQILLFRELQFPLKEIRAFMTVPGYNREKALDQQIGLLNLRKRHLEQLILYAENMKEKKGDPMDFSAFDTRTLKEYEKRAKSEWGNTDAYREYETRTKNWTRSDYSTFADDLMQLFAEFGQMKNLPPDDPKPQAQVRKLQKYITDHMYRCTDEILLSLGDAYESGGEFTKNIDAAGGEGTARFTAEAIRSCCRNS